ncbi:MAG: hypothetical protein IKA05_01720 [Clostridia bacterium]|nr:hypothetical protein [Clostridia bacterium]
MKKYVCMLLMFCMFLGCFAGCNVAEKDPIDSTEQPTESQSEGAETQTTSTSKPATNEPPFLCVSNGEISVGAWRGTYSWTVENEDGEGRTVHADSEHPLDCLETIQSTFEAMKVSQDTTLALDFEFAPTSIMVRRYNLKDADSGAYEEIPVNGSSIEVRSGAYLYEVIAKWESNNTLYSGTVQYAFCTEN